MKVLFCIGKSWFIHNVSANNGLKLYLLSFSLLRFVVLLNMCCLMDAFSITLPMVPWLCCVGTP